MNSVDLGGFDVVVHLGETVINQGLELLPSGSTFPVDLRRTLDLTLIGVPDGIGGPSDVGMIYDAFVQLERPRVELDSATQTVKVRCDLAPASLLTFLRPSNAAQLPLLASSIPQIPLAGTVELSCPFGTADVTAVWGSQTVSGLAAVANASGVATTLTLSISAADSAGNVPVAIAALGSALLTITTAAIEDALESALGNAVGDAIGTLPLTNPVRLNAGTTPPQIVRDLTARITTAGPTPAISLGVLTAIVPASPGGTIPAPPADLGTLGAVLGVANYWTLQLICTAMHLAHPSITFTIQRDPPSAHFDGAVVLPGGEEPVTLDRLDITASAGKIQIDGHARASGTCWDASIDFDFEFSFTCDPETGAVVATASTPNVNPSVDKDLWCQILGAIIGALGGIVSGAIIGAIIGAVAGGGPGAICGAIIGGIAGGVVGGIAGFVTAGALIDPLDLDGVSLDSLSVLGGLTLPLPVGAAGLLVKLCDFDDLEVRGDLAYVDFAERHRSGSVRLAAGEGFDLDAGVIRRGLDGVADDTADVWWGGTALATLPGSTLGPVYGATSTAFATTSLTDLQGFTYAPGSIRLSLIPATVATRSKGIQRGTRCATFALRTDQGRYAKCRAQRDAMGGITLEYIVYAQPRMCMDTVLEIETVSRRIVDSGEVTCTVVKPDVVIDPVHGVPHALVAQPATTVVARVAHGLKDDIASMGDLVADVGVRLPTRSQSCGTNTTVERDLVEWQLVDRRRRLSLRALPKGGAAPFTYRWTAFGIDLEGSGATTINGIDIAYNEHSPILTLDADVGVDVAGSIVVHATDADGRALRTVRNVHSLSRKREGGCCEPARSKLTLHDAALLLDRAQVAQRVYDAGMTRLRRIAAGAVIHEVEPIAVTDAIKQLDRS